MKILKTFTKLTLAVLMMTSTFALANNADPIKTYNEEVTSELRGEENPTIVGVAASNDNFSTLVAAVTAAAAAINGRFERSRSPPQPKMVTRRFG